MELEPTLTVDEFGTRIWRLNGEFHRTDGPAIEYADGRRIWCLNGLRHRTDGPAVEYVNGDRAWYLNGRNYNFQDWLNELDEHTRLLMTLKYGT